MKKKRGQMSIGRILLYVFFVIVAVFAVIFGYNFLSGLQGQAHAGEINNFYLSLENKFTAMASGSLGGKGSISEEVFSLPPVVSEVCFVDRADVSAYDRFVSLALEDQLQIYDDENVFLGDDFFPFKVSHFKPKVNPTCVKVRNGKLSLRLENLGNAVLVDGFVEEEVKRDCETVVYQQEPADAVDITFLGEQYGDVGAFKEAVSGYVNDLFLSNAVFQEHAAKMNFYLVGERFDFDCNVGNWVECDTFLVKKAATQCPSDFTIVLIPRSRFLDILKPVRSAALGNVMFVNTADNANVILHEFAHSFAGLGDEYVDEGFYGSTGFSEEGVPNCDTAACSEWELINGTGCFAGCSLGKFFRPTESSVMRTLDDEHFGPVNSLVMEEKFKVYD